MIINGSSSVVPHEQISWALGRQPAGAMEWAANLYVHSNLATGTGLRDVRSRSGCTRAKQIWSTSGLLGWEGDCDVLWYDCATLWLGGSILSSLELLKIFYSINIPWIPSKSPMPSLSQLCLMLSCQECKKLAETYIRDTSRPRVRFEWQRCPLPIKRSHGLWWPVGNRNHPISIEEIWKDPDPQLNIDCWVSITDMSYLQRKPVEAGSNCCGSHLCVVWFSRDWKSHEITPANHASHFSLKTDVAIQVAWKRERFCDKEKGFRAMPFKSITNLPWPISRILCRSRLAPWLICMMFFQIFSMMMMMMMMMIGCCFVSHVLLHTQI